MKRLSPLRVGAAATFALVTIFVTACDTIVEPLSKTSTDPEALAQISPANTGATTGPWAKCTLGPDDVAFGIPEVCPDPASKGCGGFSSRIVDLDDGNEVCVVANYCQYDCKADADCPMPQSGSVKPICRQLGGGTCYLPCTETSQCPDGMKCFDEGGSTENGVANHCQWTYACPDALTK